VKAVILTNADVDHIGGLLSLREQHAFTIWASARVIAQIEANPIFAALNREFVTFTAIEAGKSFEALPGLRITAFEVPGKVPLYRETEEGFAVSRNGDTLGLHIEAGSKRASYVPGCGDIDDRLRADLNGTDVLLFDGTLWKDDEMIASGTGTKTGRRMGHVPVSGPDGSMALLARAGIARRYFIHLNNTNPLLVDGSPERREAEAAGWLVADDGLEINL
jgi:pyrroloquinoline quinone biosynthesis protein B